NPMQVANNLILSTQTAANGAWRNISNFQCYSIHITGVEGHVWIEVANDPSILTDGATIAAPAAPVLSQFTPIAGTGISGYSANTTYFVKTTLVTAGGETTPSTESSLLVSKGNLLTVAPPAKDTGGYAVGWNVYVSTVTNTERIQNLEDNAVVASLSFGQTFILKNLLTNST